jgi:ubiquinone/menaquinone biosynthesis C-methylase UbiE
MTTTIEYPRLPASRALEAEYRPFPDRQGRNSRQEWFEVPAMVLALELPAGVRILEVGCGRGVALPELHRMLAPSRLTGLDIDPAALAEAKARARRRATPVELVPGDVRELPFPDGAFDLVVDFGTCYHIARAGTAIREIARVLARGGIFVCETRISQFLSHPARSRGRRLPDEVGRLFRHRRSALLWTSRLVNA